MKVDPDPGSLFTDIRPPSACASSLLIASPSPVPDRSPPFNRLNSSKM
jgi:hypothetical protein